MITIKSYTDIEQSKKLVKILPFESADMGFYYSSNLQTARNQMWVGTKAKNADIPCWSLTALLNIIPEVSLNAFKDKIWNVMVKRNGKIIYEDKNNPVDACVELIIKLKKENLL